MDHDTKITVSRTIDAPAAEVFDVLTLPRNHVQLDGSGFVVSDEHADRITGTGQVFTMNMTGDHMGGDYQTDNHVTAYDPEAMAEARHQLGDRIQYADTPLSAAQHADALVLVTEWNEFRNPSWALLERTMRGRAVFDGRNIWDPARVREAGFEYTGIGRP